VLQDAAVLEVFELVERIDAADERHFLHRAVRIGDPCGHPGARLEICQPLDGYRLVALEAEFLPARIFGEDEGDDTHANEIGAVDALKGAGDDRAYAE